MVSSQSLTARKVNDRVALPANASATWPGTLGDLAASIAHEAKQPLTAIVTNGEACLRWLAADEPNLDEARACVAAMIGSALRTSEITRGLCALAGNAECRQTRLNLNEVIEEAIPLMEGEVRRSNVAVKLDLASEPLVVLGNRVQLQQVIINLMSNGIQAMAQTNDRTRELRVRSRRSENQASVTVQDAGTGLDPHDIDRMFKSFYTTKAAGMDVGLTICRSIIESHGGLIRALCNPDRGAAFCFVLPVAAEAP